MAATVFPLPPALGQLVPFQAGQLLTPAQTGLVGNTAVIAIGGPTGSAVMLYSLNVDVEADVVDVSSNGCSEVSAFGASGLASYGGSASGQFVSTVTPVPVLPPSGTKVWLTGSLLQPNGLLNFMGGPGIIIHTSETLYLGFVNSNAALAVQLLVTGQLVVLTPSDVETLVSLRNSWRLGC